MSACATPRAPVRHRTVEPGERTRIGTVDNDEGQASDGHAGHDIDDCGRHTSGFRSDVPALLTVVRPLVPWMVCGAHARDLAAAWTSMLAKLMITSSRRRIGWPVDVPPRQSARDDCAGASRKPPRPVARQNGLAATADLLTRVHRRCSLAGESDRRHQHRLPPPRGRQAIWRADSRWPGQRA